MEKSEWSKNNIMMVMECVGGGDENDENWGFVCENFLNE